MNIDQILAAYQVQRQIESQLDKDEFLKNLDLQSAGKHFLLLSGQKRSMLWARWLVLRGYYEEEVAAVNDRGDLRVGDAFDELKTATLTSKELKKFASRGNQVRLWQDLRDYLFITTNKDTYETKVHRISKNRLMELYKEGKIRFSSSHITGNDKSAALKGARVEIGFQFNNKDYDWNEFLVNEEQI